MIYSDFHAQRLKDTLCFKEHISVIIQTVFHAQRLKEHIIVIFKEILHGWFQLIKIIQ